MRLSSKDIAVILCAAGVVCASSFGLYLDFSFAGKGTGEQIGTIVFKKKRAERKFNNSSEWEYVSQQNIPVFNNDSLRTSEGSAATVHLKDGSTVDLDENTLIMITLSGGGTMLNFSGGTVNATKGSGSSGLKVNSGKTTVDVASGGMSVTGKDVKNISVNVSSGSANLSVGGKSVEVKKDQAAVVSGGSADVKEQPFALIGPSHGQYFPSNGGKGVNVDFSWKSKAQGATIQISADRSFKDTVVSKKANDAYKTTLADGDYYWRVVGAGDAESEVRRFSVQQDSPVVPLSPVNGEAISFIISRPPVHFRWSQSQFASSYDVEISVDPSFSKKNAELNSRLPSISVDTLDEGVYYWRVRPLYPSGVRGEFAKKGARFLISRAHGVSAPSVVFPPDDYSKSVHSVASAGIPLNWRGDGDITDYTVEISKDNSFAKKEISEKVSGNLYLAKKFPVGVYYWRVKVSAGRMEESPYSEPRKFNVVNDVPVILHEVDDDDQGGLVFSWKDPNDVGLYVLELSGDQSFAAPVKKDKTRQQSLTVKDLSAGNYFWRVTAVDQSGKAVVQSSVKQYSMSGRIDSPVVLSPSNNHEINAAKTKKIAFLWKKVKNATEYEIEVYKYSQSSEKKVWSGTVKKETAELSDFTVLSEGKFYWQVKAVRRTGSVISASSLPSKGYFAVTSGANIVAPKVGTIKVYVQ
jgi:hypothetical protein